MSITTTLKNNTRALPERLIDDGASDVSDAELLSLFIRGKNGVSSIERSEAILQSLPLIKLFRNPHCAQYRALGISKNQLTQIHAGMELAKRAVAAKIQSSDALTSPNDVRKYLALQMTGFEDERFSVLFLCNRHTPLAFKTISYGTIDSASVPPRSVVKAALACNAAACIYVHNHPNAQGSSEPSDTDVRLTRKLVDALNLLDIRTLDHLVYAQGNYTSLAERGLM